MSSVHTQANNDLLALSFFFVAREAPENRVSLLGRKHSLSMGSSDCFSYQNTEGSLSFDPLDLLYQQRYQFRFFTPSVRNRGQTFEQAAPGSGGFLGSHRSKRM